MFHVFVCGIQNSKEDQRKVAILSCCGMQLHCTECTVIFVMFGFVMFVSDSKVKKLLKIKFSWYVFRTTLFSIVGTFVFKLYIN